MCPLHCIHKQPAFFFRKTGLTDSYVELILMALWQAVAVFLLERSLNNVYFPGFDVKLLEGQFPKRILGETGAKTIKKSRAWIGAQLTICAQK